MLRMVGPHALAMVDTFSSKMVGDPWTIVCLGIKAALHPGLL